MSEPNPYQPPQEPEPLTTRKGVKRGVGVVLIVALTPVAVFVAFFISCFAAIWSTEPMLNGRSRDAQASQTAFNVIMYVPPVVVGIGMLIWALFSRRRQLLSQDKVGKTTAQP